jgi:uncharacterized SAM-binding protein YcdF (DUF218 family)
VNQLLLSLGIENWKPTLSALVLPPLPFVLLVLLGARAMFARRWLGWLLVLVGCAGVWLSCTTAAGTTLTRWLLQPPRALSSSDIAELKRAPKTAIVVLGSGRRLLAPEYGMSNLTARAIERLRFGLWLARETALPVAFTGGVGLGAAPGPTEAEIAARISEREFGFKLRWLEAESRDTRESAVRSVALLHAQGIEHLVLVTHDYHMPRTRKNFEAALAAQGVRLQITQAPLGMPDSGRLYAGDWLPSLRGFESTWLALHEALGVLMGA